ncbi:hypothetical protein BU25DRAFT_416185 [Macroventuria anomochaeta]|uniref:Uncharacterized protein n=1 Tax=Macroventuria anomochaeta TaxID=301207 RepID=A0ACB6RHI0_9PLEO|nr:uncharacterized protein BU25DRAFT_416185 [Macroventuria anomochaeta]KAF2621411.1 hypothetical protein BU25DRAFT_416185 [Macroventuria anomochaeta]
MAAISGLMVGTQYCPAYDLPFDSKELRIQIIMVAVGIFFVIVQELAYVLYNRRALRKWKEEGGEKPWLYTP